MNYSIGWDGPGERDDPVEDGQAECQRCGEWYRVTAPRDPHECPPTWGERRYRTRLTPPAPGATAGKD